MSAIHEGTRLTGSVTKLHTSAKVLVHSHNRTEAYNLSDDVWSIQTGKNIKGVGQANIALVPRINFLNYLGPNDYVNIYFNKHDGHGWVRTFFGLIDRIEEDYSVSEQGEPTTTYHLICSDFAKIFDTTEYYTNSHLHGHDVFSNAAVGNLLPALAIRTQGLLLTGGPAEMVTQIIFTFLGFSQQFTLPESYASAITNTAILSQNRGLRLNFAESLMNESQIQGLGEGGVQGLISGSQVQTQRQLEGLDEPASASSDRTTLLRQVSETLDLDIAQIDSMRAQNPQALSRLLTEANISRELFSLPGAGQDNDVGTMMRSVAPIIRGASPVANPTVLDLMNVGSFIERETIDGFTYNSAIPNYQGNIVSLMRQHSHDMVNELFFDLRAVSDDPSGMLEGAQWSVDPDELAGNVDHSENAGVRYVPSVIMRENPFSTIDAVDASGVTLGLRGPNNELLQYGLFPIGAIYSNKPNVPGRHIIDFPNINAVDKMQGRSNPGKRHLDVATISSADIVKTTFGRSDTDHVNLTGLISHSFMGQSAQQYMKDLSPTVSPIHVQRHGLRVRILTTRFARLHDSGNQGQQPTRPAAAIEPQQSTATEPEVEEAVPTVEAPRTTVWAPPAIVRERHPLELNQAGANVLMPNATAGTRWGYVRTSRSDASKVRMHNGIDIYGAVGSRVQAIADGEIVRKFVNGRQQIYGNILVIKHEGMGDEGENVYSVYAHMGQPKTEGQNNSICRSYKAGEDISEAFARIDADSTNVGRRLEIGDRVRAGQIIGYLGWTGGRTGNPDGGLGQPFPARTQRHNGVFMPPAGPHLHFEITREVGRSNTFYPSNAGNGSLQSVPRSDVTVRERRIPPFHNNEDVSNRLCSIDPVAFLLRKGVNLLEPGVMNQLGITTPEADDPEENLIEPDDQAVPDQEAVTQAAGVENQAAADTERQSASTQGTGTGIDNSSIRNLLARWMILQDHWYQHNLEYLSGDIVMARGAPEIRVGYRLDIVDRNLSFYVENVAHQWQMEGPLHTSLKVTRGQPNNPYPAYILPRNPGFQVGEDQRFAGSRLGKYFIIPDPIAVKRGRVIRQGYDGVHGIESPDTNVLDEEFTLNQTGEKYISSVSFADVDVSLDPDVTTQAGVAEYARVNTEQAVQGSALQRLNAESGMSILPLDGSNIQEALSFAPSEVP